MMTTTKTFSGLLALGFSLAAMPRGSLGQPGGGGIGEGPGISTDTADLVYCDEDGADAHYYEALSGSGSTMVRYGGSESGCPNHINWDLNPNSAAVQPSNESIPAYPMMIADSGTTDLSSTPNAIGVMRNGVAMFSSWALNTVVTYEDTAFYLEADTFDLCGGHSTVEGTYHYHSTAGCLQEQAAIEAGTSSDDHSAVLGWAYDGFPIYGQLGPGGVEMKMCGETDADDTVCLDACSGYEAEIPDTDDFTYRYYTSCGFDESFFPFTANCYRGCCPDGIECSEKVDACGSSAEEGYTADYEPEVYSTLHEQYDADLIDGDDTDQIGTENSVDCSLYAAGSSEEDASGAVSRTTIGNSAFYSGIIAVSIATIGAIATSTPSAAASSLLF